MLHTMTEIDTQLYKIIIVGYIIQITMHNIAKYCMHFTFYGARHHRQQHYKTKTCGSEQTYGKPSLTMVCSTPNHAVGMW